MYLCVSVVSTVPNYNLELRAIEASDIHKIWPRAIAANGAQDQFGGKVNPKSSVCLQQIIYLIF